MTDTAEPGKQPDTGSNEEGQTVVDRLVFAALREQTRARRWRVGFMLFFIGYLSVVTTMLFFKVGPNPREWWGEMIETPSVAEGGVTVEDAKRLTAHVDFGVPDRKIWEDPESIADKLVRYAAVLA